MECSCKKTNLKTETLNVLSDFGLTESDILWVGGNDFTIPTEKFWELAESIDYDFGFGNQVIANDLTIMCNGGYLIRSAYEGCEWWKFHLIPKKPNNEMEVERLSLDDDTEEDCSYGKTIKEINFGNKHGNTMEG